jgi:transcriptional regulator
MANKLLGMQKKRQILLFLDRGVSQRSIEKELKISRKNIGVYLQKARETGFWLSNLLNLLDEQLEQTLGLTKSST